MTSPRALGDLTMSASPPDAEAGQILMVEGNAVVNLGQGLS
jgi:hypothetical protein